jgi:hypothetical protein
MASGYLYKIGFIPQFQGHTFSCTFFRCIIRHFSFQESNLVSSLGEASGQYHPLFQCPQFCAAGPPLKGLRPQDGPAGQRVLPAQREPLRAEGRLSGVPDVAEQPRVPPAGPPEEAAEASDQCPFLESFFFSR